MVHHLLLKFVHLLPKPLPYTAPGAPALREEVGNWEKFQVSGDSFQVLYIISTWGKFDGKPLTTPTSTKKKAIQVVKRTGFGIRQASFSLLTSGSHHLLLGILPPSPKPLAFVYGFLPLTVCPIYKVFHTMLTTAL